MEDGIESLMTYENYYVLHNITEKKQQIQTKQIQTKQIQTKQIQTKQIQTKEQVEEKQEISK
jgi:hypothetical protein